eukprot:9418125-Alexandrium_andersonii.AAC.1
MLGALWRGLLKPQPRVQPGRSHVASAAQSPKGGRVGCPALHACRKEERIPYMGTSKTCLLYTSDAADDM